jgi:TBCC domain-containing protein 1
MAANSIPAITLWLKSEPFTIGALPTPPNPRLTISNIKRIIPYARTKSRSGFPNLGYSVWKHIASNKLLLPEDLTWTYFWTYDLLGDRTPEQRLEWQERFAKASSDPQSQETLKHQLTVPVLKFVLLLYIQHIHKISLRASLVSGSDEWPTRTRSPDLESRSASSSKALDENSHLTFILNNLNEILEILAESGEFKYHDSNSDFLVIRLVCNYS